jgi:hypothetical protein
VQIKHFVENLLYGNIRPSSVSEQRIVTGGSWTGGKAMMSPKGTKFYCCEKFRFIIVYELKF